MSGGGKGGSTTSKVTIPAWLEDAARGNIAKANEIAQTGYVPYYGPDVAAMSPQQIAAMKGTNQAALAFGLDTADPMAGLPTPTTYENGMQGYSSGGLYDQAIAELKSRAPAQYDALMAPFINPVTGEGPAAPYGTADAMYPTAGQSAAAAGAQSGGKGSSYSSMKQDYGGPSYGGSGSGGGSLGSTLSSYAPGGVNTRNPSSAFNQAVARAMSPPQGAPTAANRPQPRPSGSGGSSGMGGGK